MRAFVLPVLALASLLLAPLARAASFDCAKAASTTEKTVCADPTLSTQDSVLATAWKQALSRVGDPAALRASQRDWLKQRDACASDRACLDQRYRERLHALGATGDVAGPWQQAWVMDLANGSAGARLVFSGHAPHLHFTLDGNNGANSGSLAGDVSLQGQQASYRGSGCQLDFDLQGQRLQVRQQGGDCGAGMGVSYSGNYVPASAQAKRAKPDLLSLKVLASAAQNQAAHALLGADYQALVDTVNVQGEEQDLDGLGAKVTGYFVRGVANSEAAMLMSKGTELWIGLLAIDRDNQVRTRYYTNVPAWKQRLPKTIQQWHDNIDPKLPIDKMP